jgi:hypothetical protein
VRRAFELVSGVVVAAVVVGLYLMVLTRGGILP